MVQCTAPGVSGTTSVPTGQTMPTDEGQQENTRAINRARTITQSRVPSIEVPGIHCTTYRRRRKSIKTKASRSRVDVAEAKNTTPNLDLEELKRHVRVGRRAQVTVRQRAVDVSQEAVSYQMDVGDIAGKGRSLWDRVGLAWKRFLEKNNRWTMSEYISLKLKKLVVAGDTTNVPGK